MVSHSDNRMWSVYQYISRIALAYIKVAPAANKFSSILSLSQSITESFVLKKAVGCGMVVGWW